MSSSYKHLRGLTLKDSMSTGTRVSLFRRFLVLNDSGARGWYAFPAVEQILLTGVSSTLHTS